MFSVFMYGHGKLDLKFLVYGNAEIEIQNISIVESTKINGNVYTSKAENAEEIAKPQVLETKYFVQLQSHLLPQK